MADVVILSGEIVTTVFEMKSDKGGVSQNKEQMAGLLQDNQRTILGIVVGPAGCHINWFIAHTQQGIICHHILRHISLERDVEHGLTKLAQLITYFNNMLIKQPTLAVERKEEKREEGYKGLHSGLTITGLTTTHELWYT